VDISALSCLPFSHLSELTLRTLGARNMRIVVGLAACVGIAVAVAGCDPVLEQRYYREGGGIDLYSADGAKQLDLQNQYISYICSQAGLTGAEGICTPWALFVQAGLNDIDQRCDAYLTWLDALRRDRAPILAELAAIGTVTSSIMTIAGASPKALNIATAAFGLASMSYDNWNSRLLLSVNQSTVQSVVYGRQQQFRQTVLNYPVADRAYAIYLLRNYLRICMPITIETEINTSTTLVHRGAGLEAETPVAGAIPPAGPAAVHIRANFTVDSAGDALTKFVYPNGVSAARDPAHEQKVKDFLTQNSINASVTFFLKSSTFATNRMTLARQLGLIR
jgi:hypothetical protein